MRRPIKRILFAFIALVFLWSCLFVTDAYRCSCGLRPLFVRPVETADDGGSGLYAGPLYRVELQLDGMLDPPAAPVYIHMTLFGKTVAVSGAPLPETPPATTDLSMVMIGGVLYFESGPVSCINPVCGTPDGVIESTVSPGLVPTQNGQSNFGSGYEYQFAGEGELYVFIDDHRILFTDTARICCYPEADTF